MVVASSRRAAPRGASAWLASLLPRPERLRTAREFARVYGEGIVFHEEGITLRVAPMPEHPAERRVGFAVNRKVGNAVIRNRVRRQLRAAVRSLSGRLGRGVLLVFTARPAAARAPYQRLAHAVERAVSRAGLLSSTATAPVATLEDGIR